MLFFKHQSQIEWEWTMNWIKVSRNELKSLWISKIFWIGAHLIGEELSSVFFREWDCDLDVTCAFLLQIYFLSKKKNKNNRHCINTIMIWSPAFGPSSTSLQPAYLKINNINKQQQQMKNHHEKRTMNFTCKNI